MTHRSEDEVKNKTQDTVNIIGDIIDKENDIINFLESIEGEKKNLRSGIEEYLRKINPRLFLWENYINKNNLLKEKINVNISLAGEQPQLFSSNPWLFKCYPIKEFHYFTGELDILIKCQNKIQLQAKIVFCQSDNFFEWDDGSKEYFFSEPHLQMNEKRFGEVNFFDISNAFFLGKKTIRKCNEHGEYEALIHLDLDDPIDIINRKIQKRFIDNVNKIYLNQKK